jgi:hypothetical protein
MERLLERFAAAAAILSIAAIIGTIGLAAIGVAAYQALLEIVPPAQAALLTGVGALLFAGILLLMARARMRSPKTVVSLPTNSLGEQAAGFDASRLAGELGGLIGGEFGAVAHKSPRKTVATSLLIGVALGASPGLRGTLFDLLRNVSRK